jgi:hypothetical protein
MKKEQLKNLAHEFGLVFFDRDKQMAIEGISKVNEKYVAILILEDGRSSIRFDKNEWVSRKSLSILDVKKILKYLTNTKSNIIDPKSVFANLEFVGETLEDSLLAKNLKLLFTIGFIIIGILIIYIVMNRIYRFEFLN